MYTLLCFLRTSNICMTEDLPRLLRFRYDHLHRKIRTDSEQVNYDYFM